MPPDAWDLRRGPQGEAGEPCPCPRCKLTDWALSRTDYDWRCGGCGYWFVSEMLRAIGVIDAVSRKHLETDIGAPSE